MDFITPIFKWLHIIAGVLWIGLLYFFNWINGHVVATMDADTKKKVIPELMPRTLYFFRWGAAWTWFTGVILLLIVFYHGGLTFDDGSGWGTQAFVMIAVTFLGVFLYDTLYSKDLIKINNPNKLSKNLGITSLIILAISLVFPYLSLGEFDATLIQIATKTENYDWIGVLFLGSSGVLLILNSDKRLSLLSAIIGGAFPIIRWYKLAAIIGPFDTGLFGIGGYLIIVVMILQIAASFKEGKTANVHIMTIISFVLVGIVVYLMKEWAGFSYRSFNIHLGVLFGTNMAFNVWYRIWPAQQRIITAIKNGEAPDPADVGLAGLRSKHNTYMSVPLIWTMINQHTTVLAGGNFGVTESINWLVLMIMVAIGWHIVFQIYKKSAKVQGF